MSNSQSFFYRQSFFLSFFIAVVVTSDTVERLSQEPFLLIDRERSVNELTN